MLESGDEIYLGGAGRWGEPLIWSRPRTGDVIEFAFAGVAREDGALAR